jgi:transposase-like protein
LKEKIEVTLRIDTELYERFVEDATIEHGKFSEEVLTHEVENAMRLWLDQVARSHGGGLADRMRRESTTMAAGQSRVIRVFNQVKLYLARRYGIILLPGDRVSLRHLQEAIRAVRGIQDTTVRNWLRAFEEMGLIRPVGTSAWEVLE